MAFQADQPRISAAPEACVHFHHWRVSEGSLRILLGNIEVGAKPARFDLILPKPWLAGQGIDRPILRDASSGCAEWLAEDRGKEFVFTLEIPADTSLVCTVGKSD
jgi:hypothetical protein